MRLSVCIPNYNYGRYIGETVRSVLDQAGKEVEVCISDNQSNDESVAVVESIGDPRVKLAVNPRNVGFAANLDCAARLASGDQMLMLSSDDVLLPGAIEAYSSLLAVINAETSVVGASLRVIDATGRTLGRVGGPTWLPVDRDERLEKQIGMPVYSVPAQELLRRALVTMRNPLPFATTLYPRKLFERIGGYGHRLINPDKWFNLGLLQEADMVYFIDEELAGYRWHDANQSAQQRASGALKYLVDEYCMTFQLPDEALKLSGLKRDDLERAFVHNDVGLRGLRDLAHGDRTLARRSVRFGQAAYPSATRLSVAVWLLRAGLLLGPAGTRLAKALTRQAESLWRRYRFGRASGINSTWAWPT